MENTIRRIEGSGTFSDVVITWIKWSVILSIVIVVLFFGLIIFLKVGENSGETFTLYADQSDPNSRRLKIQGPRESFLPIARTNADVIDVFTGKVNRDEKSVLRGRETMMTHKDRFDTRITSESPLQPSDRWTEIEKSLLKKKPRTLQSAT